jgi:galactonate dehydratase
LTPSKALPILQSLEEYDVVSHFEDPLPRENLEGKATLRAELNTPIVTHFEDLDVRGAIQSGSIDGAIMGWHGANATGAESAIAARLQWPVWIQMVGTGITTAFALHLASVSEATQWPAITCYEIFDDPLIGSRFDVSDGAVAVRDEPGLGVDVTDSALSTYAIDPADIDPSPKRLIELTRPDGTCLYFAGSENVLLHSARRSESAIPFYKPGSAVRVIPERESEEWDAVYAAATDSSPVVRSEDTRLFT